jgi:hypothetical protein
MSQDTPPMYWALFSFFVYMCAKWLYHENNTEYIYVTQ